MPRLNAGCARPSCRAVPRRLPCSRSIRRGRPPAALVQASDGSIAAAGQRVEGEPAALVRRPQRSETPARVRAQQQAPFAGDARRSNSLANRFELQARRVVDVSEARHPGRAAVFGRERETVGAGHRAAARARESTRPRSPTLTSRSPARAMPGISDRVARRAIGALRSAGRSASSAALRDGRARAPWVASNAVRQARSVAIVQASAAVLPNACRVSRWAANARLLIDDRGRCRAGAGSGQLGASAEHWMN